MSVTIATSNGQLAPARLATLTAALILIDEAQKQGLIDGAPWIDRHRCRRLLMKLEAQGHSPGEDEVALAALELMGEMGVIGG